MKVLILRFSSIGDIVLTTPVLRALKDQLSNVEIHYLTKESFRPILENNSDIDRLWTIQHSLSEVNKELKNEHFDAIIDLHNNIRTLKLNLFLGRKSYSFPKLNLKKWILTKFKVNLLPEIHIVDRYFKTVENLGVKNKNYSCRYTLTDRDQIDIEANYQLKEHQYFGFAIGAQFATKRLPVDKMIELLKGIEGPIMLLGGKEDKTVGDEIVKNLSSNHIVNTCGNHTISESAFLVSKSKGLITHDTGLMHIATCFNIPIISIWGNTVPSLGMYPYYPNADIQFTINEVKDLSCRPCSKIGYSKCPKGHFNCMNKQDLNKIRNEINNLR